MSSGAAIQAAMPGSLPRRGKGRASPCPMGTHPRGANPVSRVNPPRGYPPRNSLTQGGAAARDGCAHPQYIVVPAKPACAHARRAGGRGTPSRPPRIWGKMDDFLGVGSPATPPSVRVNGWVVFFTRVRFFSMTLLTAACT
jgi:hypothetical protein